MKIKCVSYMEVDYNELDKAISKFYGQPFECVPTEEWSNDSSYNFSIEKQELGDYYKKKIEKTALKWINERNEALANRHIER